MHVKEASATCRQSLQYESQIVTLLVEAPVPGSIRERRMQVSLLVLPTVAPCIQVAFLVLRSVRTGRLSVSYISTALLVVTPRMRWEILIRDVSPHRGQPRFSIWIKLSFDVLRLINATGTRCRS
jgi:hypothetical protein